MNNISTILVIIDPTVLRDQVIDKAKLLAHRTSANVELFINCQVTGKDSGYYITESESPGNEKTKSGSGELQKVLISALKAEFSSLGVSVNIDLCQKKDLSQSIVDKVSEIHPDIVLKSTHKHNLLRQTLITNTDWQLIRSCPAPLLLTKPHGWYRNGNVVASVDPLHNKSEQITLDDDLISAAVYIADIADQQASVFHAYYYPEVGNQNTGHVSDNSKEIRAKHNQKMYQLLSEHPIDPEHVKIANGDTKNEMMNYLEMVNCNILVMGALARGSLERFVVGSTAEKILDDVPCDFLILKPQRT